MKNAIIVHGMPDKEEYYSAEFPSMSNSHWVPWLQKRLIMKDIKADTPEMPHAYLPEYEVWKREFERFDITPETILVGHSCGGGFLVRWLSENKDIKVGKVVLVAPWLNIEKEVATDIFDFKLDSSLASRTKGLTIFNSNNDDDYVQKSVMKIRAEITDMNYVEFKKYGHFCIGDMESEAFPELLEEILK
jgi:predicted alpha/beta hydrolase family esterase